MSVHIPSIFTSILDNDFYKFTMQCAVVKLFPAIKGRYEFINRGKHEFPEGFAQAMQEAVNQMGQLKLSKEEKNFLKTSCPYLNPAYIDFLEGYRYDPSEVHISQEGTTGTEPFYGKSPDWLPLVNYTTSSQELWLGAMSRL